ncbi:hypothetical protein T8S45_06690 [Blastomonas marina]|uniref:hypothetical protein n=1 Tax=Blastomonas marina TaxID=1867408 RepID=UPI002AC9D549|nr:hypothetical protein [Blastomonas marina]WPZ05217.1 hypothetical protein T8S45_06690 [Blastomonas marina]
MKVTTRIAALSAIPMALALSGYVAPADPALYTMSMDLTNNGETIAQPELQVRDGETATVHIAKPDGRSYRADVTFTRDDAGMIDMRSQIDATSPTLGDVSFAPKLKLRIGEPVRIEYGNQAPGVRPLRIEITLSEAS